MKLLIVDDEMMIKEWLKYTISSLPFEISLLETASNGEEALDKIRNEYYDLIFIDIMMPKMNGIDLLRKINELSIDSMLIVLSSHDEFKFAKEAIKLNVKEYVLKNECSKEKLSEIIHKCQEKLLNQQISSSITQEYMERVLNDNIPPNGIEIVQKIFPKIDGKTFLVAIIETEKQLLPPKYDNLQFQMLLEGVICQIDRITFCLYSIFRIDGKIDYNYNYSQHLSQMTSAKVSCGNLCQKTEYILPECRNSWIGYQSLYYSPDKHCSGRNHYREFDSKKIDNLCDKAISEIRSYSKEKTIENLKELNTYVKKTRPTDIKYVINIYLAILSTFIIYNNKQSRKVTEKLVTLRTQIQSFENFEQLSELIIRIIENNAELIYRNRFSPTVEKAIQYIEVNYKNIENVLQIADHVYLSLDYFSRQFKKEVGVTLNSYLINYRLDKASIMLISSNLSVQEVAQNVGIESGSYFSKCFKKKFHIQPIHFRIQTKE